MDDISGNKHKLFRNCSFLLYPGPAKSNNEDAALNKVIQEHGGTVVDAVTGASSITLLDLALKYDNDLDKFPPGSIPKHDVFTSAFISESVEANKLNDLNEYRFGQSNFEDYDANEILLGGLTWNNLKPKEPAKSLVRADPIVTTKLSVVRNNVPVDLLLAGDSNDSESNDSWKTCEEIEPKLQTNNRADFEELLSNLENGLEVSFRKIEAAINEGPWSNENHRILDAIALRYLRKAEDFVKSEVQAYVNDWEDSKTDEPLQKKIKLEGSDNGA